MCNLETAVNGIRTAANTRFARLRGFETPLVRWNGEAAENEREGWDEQIERPNRRVLSDRRRVLKDGLAPSVVTLRFAPTDPSHGSRAARDEVSVWACAGVRAGTREHRGERGREREKDEAKKGRQEDGYIEPARCKAAASACARVAPERER